MPFSKWPRVLTITGEAQSGKTHALIAIANAGLMQGPVTYLLPHRDWKSFRSFLRDAGLKPEVRVASVLDTGPRPATVVVDEANLLATAAREELIALCKTMGVRFLVLARTEF